MIDLPRPPRASAPEVEKEQWLERLWRIVTSIRTRASDVSEVAIEGSWVANSTYLAHQWRDGDRLSVVGSIALAGAPTAADLVLTIPGGLEIDTTKLETAVAGIGPLVGNCRARDVSGGDTYEGKVRYLTATTLRLGVFSLHDVLYQAFTTITDTVPFTFAAGDGILFDFSVPIAGWGE